MSNSINLKFNKENPVENYYTAIYQMTSETIANIVFGLTEKTTDLNEHLLIVCPMIMHETNDTIILEPLIKYSKNGECYLPEKNFIALSQAPKNLSEFMFYKSYDNKIVCTKDINNKIEKPTLN